MHGLELAQHYFPIAMAACGGLVLLVCGVGIKTQLANLKISRSRRKGMVSAS